MIEVVYPASGHETFEASTFVMGNANGHGPLRLQTPAGPIDAVVNPAGFFSQKIPLQPGANAMTLTRAGSPESVHLTVTRQIVQQQATAGIYRDTFSLRGPVAGLPGTVLPVQLVTDPVFTRLTLRWLTADGHPLTEQPLTRRPKTTATPGFHDTRTTIFGEPHWTSPPIPNRLTLWEGEVYLPELGGAGSSALLLEVRATPTTGQPVSWRPGLSVTGWQAPQLATIKPAQAICRTAPIDGTRLTPLPQGTQVEVLARWSGWAQIRLDEHLSGFVAWDDQTLTGETGWLPPASITTIQTFPDKGGLRVEIPLGRAVPVHVEAHPHRLDVTLFGVQSKLDFIRQPTNGATRATCDIPPVVAEQVSARTVRLGIHSDARLCGWSARVRPNGVWELTLRALPADPSDWIIAVDPGHGGEERGGIALDGTPEKTLNLALSRQLADALKAAGFGPIHLLRTDDRTVSLSERAERVAKLRAHVCLSIHHNALPDGRDPQAHRGAGVYYYHPVAWPLAAGLQRALVTAGCADDGVWFNNLAMTRLPGCLAVLIEAGYMTHPDDCAQLLKPTHQQQVVQALVKGLQAFSGGTVSEAVSG